jgi:DNA primase
MADFKELRQQVSIEKVADWLGINLGPKLRGACPLCEDPRSFTITPVKGLWGCFKCGKKGSILDLVMEMRQVKLPEAGKLIEEQFLGKGQSRRDSTVPAGTNAERLAKVAERLDPEHPGVDAVGFSTEFAVAHGIGFSASGAGKGYVLIPFRDETGQLLGYIGTTEELWLPKDFKEQKVVPISKRA